MGFTPSDPDVSIVTVDDNSTADDSPSRDAPTGGRAEGASGRDDSSVSFAHVLGLLLIGAGLFGVENAAIDGAIWFFLVGLLVFPRTRREIRELCGLLAIR